MRNLPPLNPYFKSELEENSGSLSIFSLQRVIRPQLANTFPTSRNTRLLCHLHTKHVCTLPPSYGFDWKTILCIFKVSLDQNVFVCLFVFLCALTSSLKPGPKGGPPSFFKSQLEVQSFRTAKCPRSIFSSNYLFK